MIQAFVCLGSNMGDAAEHLAEARAALAAMPGVTVAQFGQAVGAVFYGLT